MSNIAIKAENISKYYRLGQINNGTLFQDIQTWLALKRGREDPHSHIGENKYNNAKDGFWALKDINFEIQQGDRVGIIGKNGAGKSTLLKVISEITNPTTGTIKIKGRIASLLEVGTGFHPEMTGRENIYMNGSILGMKKYEIDRKLDEIIDFSEIEQHIDTPVKRYSSGMYVRLAFAVAAHLDSEILIADEVLAVGDASFQKKALGKMSDLSTGQGRTVLFVSHNMGAVKQLCNKGIMLEKGRIKLQETIEKVITIYNTENTTLSTNDIENIHDLRYKRGSGCIHFTQISFSQKDYYTDEVIELNYNVKVTSDIQGLHFGLCIKNEMNEPITQISQCCFEKTVSANKKYSFTLRFESNRLRPGTYPLYLWIGDTKALNQSNPLTNYEVLDGVLAPLKVKLRPSDEEYVFIQRKTTGYFNIRTENIYNKSGD